MTEWTKERYGDSHKMYLGHGLVLAVWYESVERLHDNAPKYNVGVFGRRLVVRSETLEDAKERAVKTALAWLDQAKLKLGPRRFHRIFDLKTGQRVTDVPYVVGPNRGLPDWYFDAGNLTSVVVDLDADTVEWSPPVGPAPCWKQTFSDFKNDAALWDELETWGKETF